jgi:hypothetical protein
MLAGLPLGLLMILLEERYETLTFFCHDGILS